MAKKILKMTKIYGNFPDKIGRQLMLRYVNKDWNYDVEKYIDDLIYNTGYSPKGIREPAIHILNYWKYAFLVAKGEII